MPRKKPQHADKDAAPPPPTVETGAAGAVPIPQQLPPPSKKASVFLMVVLCILCLGTTGFVFFNGSTHSVIQRQLAMFFAAILGAAALYFGASYATIEGTWKNTTFRFGGPPALGIALYLMLFYFAPTETNHPVNIFLEYQKRPLERNFHVNARLPTGHPISLDGQDGTCLMLLPSPIDSIDLAITCTGFRQKDTGPYLTKTGVIRVAMVKKGDLPPMDENAYPSTEGIKDRPTKELVQAAPRFKPTEVTFQYKNATDVDLQLLIVSWTVIYSQPNKGFQRKMPWMDWAFPAGDEFLRYDKFATGTGWFSFFVMSDKHARPVPIGTYNLFAAKRPTLVVKDSGNADCPFEAEFTKGD